LEEDLEKIDRDEPSELFLGARRRDRNQERKKVLQALEGKIAEYGIELAYPLPRDAADTMEDDQLGRYRNIMCYESPRERDIQNLRNWCIGNGAIARKETAYLAKGPDLMNAAGTTDAGVTFLQPFVEDALLAVYRLFRRVWGPERGKSFSKTTNRYRLHNRLLETEMFLSRRVPAC